MGLFRTVVERPVATLMIFIAAAVFGIVSYLRLPLNLMPDLSYPTLTVRTEVEGYAPQEVESQISRPIEEALATTEGLVELESRSRAGISDVVLEFAWGTDMDEATQSARERLQTTFLPDDAKRPLILRYDPSQAPILRIALAMDPADPSAPRGQEALFVLREVAERQVKRDIEAMDGIAAVRVRGGLERQVLVEAREDWLAARGVTLEQLKNTLNSENVNLPGGTLREGDRSFLVRTLNEVKTVDEVLDLEIRRADGVRVPVREVATVREANRDREVVSRLDGRDAVELEVYKAADANIVQVAATLEERLESQVVGYGRDGKPIERAGLRDKLPDGVVLVILEDQATFIEAAINNLRSTAVLGGVLAVAVLFGFLRDFRATGIIAAAIPISIVVTFAPMYLGGVSLNLMSLGGLALGIGMLVDNAVVVLENIQLKVDAGMPRRRAAVEGTADVAAAVTASTLTTVSVFLPISFVEGVAGQVFGDLALAVVFSLLASLVCSLFFVPMLAAIELSLPDQSPTLRDITPSARFPSIQAFKASWASRSGVGRWVRLPYWLGRLGLHLGFDLVGAAGVYTTAPAARGGVFALGGLVYPVVRLLLRGATAFQEGYDRLARRYDGAMGGVLARPFTVLGFAALTVVVALPIGRSLGQALIPELHQGRFTAELALPVGTPLSRTADLVAEVEKGLSKNAEIAHVHSIVGTERRADSRADEGEHTARVMVELVPGGDLEEREEAVMDDVREAIFAAAEVEQTDARPDVRIARPSLFSFSTPLEVVLYDNDLDRLRDASDRTVAVMSGLAGLTDVRSSLVAGYPEIQVRYDRSLLDRYGLDTGTIARQIRDKVLGTEATTIARGDGRVDMVVRVDESDRRSKAAFQRLNVNPAVTPPIPLEAVATFTEAEGPSEIRRVDQRRAAAVSANLDGFDISGQAAAIRAELAETDLGGVAWEIGGQSQEMDRSIRSLQMALALAVFLVYVIMASTFESALHPFVILFSVPLALVGVVVALAVTRTPVSVVVLIGAIVLAGVVVNNAIVLVDTINRLRDDGMERMEAIRRGAFLRLRPILITTLTTVLGLAPLAFGYGEGAEVQQPLALSIIAGLSSSTLLTLVVIPVVYALLTQWLEPRDRAEVAAERRATRDELDDLSLDDADMQGAT